MDSFGVCPFFFLSTMLKFFKADRNCASAWELLVWQRLAPQFWREDWTECFNLMKLYITMVSVDVFRNSLMRLYFMVYILVLILVPLIEESLSTSPIEVTRRVSAICVNILAGYSIGAMGVILFWMFFIMYRSLLVCASIRTMWRIERMRRRWRLDPQIGEETKVDRRRKYLRHIAGKRRKQRRWRKHQRKDRRLYDPHGGGDIRDPLEALASVQGIPMKDEILTKIEDLIAFFLAARECTSTTSFVSTTFLYLKTHYHSSVVSTAMNYVNAVFMDAQDGVVGDDGKPKWLTVLKELQSNWTLAVHNEGFEKISKVLSMCLALGLCDSADLDFKIGGMKMFSVGAYSKQVTAIDMIDAAFETVVFFVEGGYMCFATGSIKPLLYGDLSNQEFEELYSRCMRCSQYATTGNLQKHEGISPNDYEKLLEKCIEKARMLTFTSRGTLEKNVLKRKMDIVRGWQATFRQTRVQGGIRIAPYAIGVYGGTAVGKSSIAQILMVTTLKMNGYDASDDRIVTLNESDQYWSTYDGSVNGVHIDDLGNTRADFVKTAPTDLLIRLCNNAKTYANKADLDSKGKITVEPKVVITTKNVKDSCATVYSNEPASIARRDRITLTVKVRPEFSTHGMLDSKKVRESYGGSIPRIPDIWDITVEQAVPVPNKVKGKAATVGWEVVSWSGCELKNVPLSEVLRWIAQDSETHFANQKSLVENCNNLADELIFCEECSFPSDICACGKQEYAVPSRKGCAESGYCKHCGNWHDPDMTFSEMTSNSCDPFGKCKHCGKWHDVNYDTQLGTYLVKSFLPFWRRYKQKFLAKTSYWSEKIERETTSQLIKRLEWLETSRWVVWTNWIPTSWLQNENMKYVVWYFGQEELSDRIRRAYFNHCLILLLILCCGFLISPLIWLLAAIPLVAISRVVKTEKDFLYDEVVADNKAMPEIFKMYRDRHIQWITGVCVIIGSLYALIQIWKAIRIIPTDQGNINPSSDVDIKERDAEENVWAGVQITPMPCSEKSKTTTPEHLERIAFANTCHLSFHDVNDESVRYHCDAFFPCSNIALIPKHMWKADELKASFTRHHPDKIGGNFDAYLSRHYSVDIPDSDLSLVWVPNGGDWKDVTSYLPLEPVTRNCPGKLIYKNNKGEKRESKIYLRWDEIDTKVATFYGAHYNLEFETFRGLCMAPVVTYTKGPMIGGFHLGGITGDVKGCCGLLDQATLRAAIVDLKQKHTVVLSPSEGTIPTSQYDVQYFEKAEVHHKSPVNFLKKANCKFYGQVKGRAKYRSEVKTTKISPLVEKYCGVPQKWGGPKFHTWKPWQVSLSHSVNPSPGMEGNLLNRAVRDYTQTVLAKLKDFPGLRKDIRKLTEMETVCGIDGKRFIDKMPPNTSVGYPLTGPKSEYLTMLDPAEYPNQQYPVVLDQKFWDCAAEMVMKYLKGERAYPIFKGCLKDEPTKLTKDKVRVFQAAPIALQLLVRQYFLPIARALSMLPLTSECAVGINAHGPEWDTLAKHIRKFGHNRILAGDYSKYDLRMPAQVMFAAFRVMIDIAEECGYTAEDIQVMEGIASDICYPLMAYNGDLIQHFGSNPSGQNLTVYINSIVNSLLLRCAYFDIYSETTTPFNEMCAVVTYGDDVKGSVKEGWDDYNHISVADFLRRHDMVFTMPDKESDPVPYMNDSEADFLKRKNVYSPETKHIMGVLDEESIFKSLHCVLNSELSDEEHCATNVSGALNEWFLYGRSHFNMRVEQMTQVMDEAGIACPDLARGYDERLEDWCTKYLQ